MAAGGFPTLDLVTEVGYGEYLGPGHHAMAMALPEAVGTPREAPSMYQIATRQIPQGEVGVSQVYGSFLPWSDLASTQHTGALHELNEHRVPGLELNVGMYDDTPARQEHEQQSVETYNVDIGQQREILIFPEGEDDAVTITGSDLEGLNRMSFLSNNIIDFYIKFLERRGLSSEERERFYFFNSFFFTKLLGDSRSIAHECGVDFDGVRSWTGEVNLFEKDYVVIPILRSSHWSLIIVCHLNGLTNAPDKRRGPPRVYHLDPIEGKHESFEDQIRSYLIQACMESYRASNDRDRIVLGLACEMKYVRAQVPQQGNGHDCGVYLLHYIEVFLHESTSLHFNFASTSNIWGLHFAEEASAKRRGIRSLISELSISPQVHAGRPMDIQPRAQPRASDAPNSRGGRRKCSSKPPKGQSKLSKKWQEKETKLLLERMVERGRIRKGRAKGATQWDLISQNIETELGLMRTEDECRRRYDTLLKAYKKVKKTGKPLCDIRGKERVELNLATPLTDEWYRAIDTICPQRDSGNAKSRKRSELSSSDDNGTPLGLPCWKQVAIPRFSTLREDLRFTLLNLIEFAFEDGAYCFRGICELEEVSRMLAIVEDRKPWEIRRNICELSELKLVDFKRVNRSNNKGKYYLELDNLWVFEKFVEKVLLKNPDLDIYQKLWENDDIVSFPQAPALLSLQRIRVLTLYYCFELKQVDLSCFPELRCVSICGCYELRLVTGWEAVTKLGSLDIEVCELYVDFPPVQHLTSLRDFMVEICDSSEIQMMNLMSDFSQCVRLQRLMIIWVNDFPVLNNIDLSTLRFLESLTLSFCKALTTIQGLSGLQSLTTLELSWCKSLRRVPELACLKALTDLNMRWSGVEEIPGVEELYSLTTLDLDGCRSLKMLPSLGHLKALAHLGIRHTGVEEIPGVEDLVSMKTLWCDYSNLKGLLDLHHLPQLQEVFVRETPLIEMDASSFYFGKDVVRFNSSNVEGKVCVTEISDISDTEPIDSDDDH